MYIYTLFYIFEIQSLPQSRSENSNRAQDWEIVFDLLFRYFQNLASWFKKKVSQEMMNII